MAGAECGKEKVAPVYTCEKESSEAIDSMPSGAVYVELSKRKSIVDATGTAQKESRQISTGKSSLSQRAKEYALYMTRFPNLCASDKTKLKHAIEEELQYEKFKNKTLADLNLSTRPGQETPILDRFSINTGVSLKFLHPPVQRCIRCTGNLHVHHTWNVTLQLQPASRR